MPPALRYALPVPTDKPPQEVQIDLGFLEKIPESARAFAVLAEAADKEGLFATAEQFARKALALDPNLSDMQILYGRLLFSRGRLEEAEQVASRATVAPELRAPLLNGLATAYRGNGRLADARRMLAIGCDESFGETLRSRFCAQLLYSYLEAGMNQEARELALRAFEDRAGTELVMSAQHFFEQSGEKEKAAELGSRLHESGQRELPPATRQAYAFLASTLAERGVKLVSVQYPTQNVAPLAAAVAPWPEVKVVDNEELFLEALRTVPYDALFVDRCYGVFGHATRRGNRLLAGNIARAILGKAIEVKPDE